MREGNPSQTLREWFRRVWNERDERAIYELFPPEGEAHGLGPAPLIGPGAFHQVWLQLNHALQGIEVTILATVEDGNRCFARCAARATHVDTPVVFEGAVEVEVRGGQIVRAWNYWDFLSLMGRIGSIPPDALALALSGKRFS